MKRLQKADGKKLETNLDVQATKIGFFLADDIYLAAKQHCLKNKLTLRQYFETLIKKDLNV